MGFKTQRLLLTNSELHKYRQCQYFMVTEAFKERFKRADFLVRSTFGVSLVAFCILLPFAINNFIQGRLIDGVISMGIASLFIVNTVFCWRGYYFLWLNLLAIVPGIILGSFNALYSLGALGSYWSYLSVLSIYFILPLNYAKHASIVFFVTVTYAAYQSLDLSLFARFTAVLIGICIFTYISNREIVKTQTLLKQQSVTDSLTGAMNRTTLTKHLEQAIESFSKDQIKSVLCMIDIDHFKEINDSLGHSAGDKVLIELTEIFEKNIAADDLFFRIGGEEFILLMKDTNTKSAFEKTEELRKLVENSAILDNQTVTVSMGNTEVETSFDWKIWLNESDKKLYHAKQNGRNRIVI